MTSEDLKTMAQIGRALWANPAQAEPITVETLSAVSLLALSDDRAVERAARALLDRASREGMAGNALSNLFVGGAVSSPFFRLLPEERFLLVALHAAHWSYARLARILEDSVENVEARAWVIRVRLAAEVSQYAAGAGAKNAHCPEYLPQRPWTQRFLDEEFESGRERFFLQNHLMACDSCRAALGRCRDVYYAVDRLIPRFENPAELERLLGELEQVRRRSTTLVSPSERTFGESLQVFFQRPDARLAFLVLLGTIFYLIFRIG